jgi:hypothetical protein
MLNDIIIIVDDDIDDAVRKCVMNNDIDDIIDSIIDDSSVCVYYDY